MFQLSTEQKVCEVGGVKFGGQPGDYPCVCVSSIFQKGDKVFTGKRKEGFDEARAEMLLKNQDKYTADTGVPGMADIVANTGKEFKSFIDFVVSTGSQHPPSKNGHLRCMRVITGVRAGFSFGQAFPFVSDSFCSNP